VFYLYINDTRVNTIEDSGMDAGLIGIISEIYNGGSVTISYDNIDLRGTTTANTLLEGTHSPSPAKFQPGGSSRSTYTCAFKTSVEAIRAGVRIENFGAYFWENNQWVHSTSNNGQPWSSEVFADWYSCPGAYIGPGQECSDPNNWIGGDSSTTSKSKWYYVGVDDNGNEVQGEAVIECQS
jgi:hypothetical protein